MLASLLSGDSELSLISLIALEYFNTPKPFQTPGRDAVTLITLSVYPSLIITRVG